MSGSVDAVEVAAERLASGLKLVQAAKDIEQRRRIVIEDVGKLVGKLDAAMEHAAAGRIRQRGQRLRLRHPLCAFLRFSRELPSLFAINDENLRSLGFFLPTPLGDDQRRIVGLGRAFSSGSAVS